ncbi:MAG: ABC transporter permease [Nanoarchaeota archaeon]
MLSDYFQLAANSLRRRRLRSWLTMIGVIIGITAVIALIGIGDGLRLFVTGQFNLAGADTITVSAASAGFGPPGAGVVNPLTKNDLQRVRSVKGVDTAIGRLIESGQVIYNDKAYFGYVATVPSGKYAQDLYDVIGYEAEEGRLLRDGDDSRVVVGHDYTDPDRFDKDVRIGSNLRIEGREFTVVGILKKRGSFVVDNTILMTEDVARALFKQPQDEYDAIGLRVQAGADMDKVQADIERALRSERNVKEGEEDFSVQTPENALEGLNSTLFAVNLFVILIASISILVGGIGIMNTMYTAVLERIGEIGTMKAIGARNADIFWIFAFESGIIGLIGGIVGVLLGSGLAAGLAAIARVQLQQDTIQASIGLTLVLGALIGSFIIGLAAGIFPAMRASRLHPVDALNYSK